MASVPKVGVKRFGKEWTHFFKSTNPGDLAESLDFMKRLTYYSFSQILGCRKVIPNTAVKKQAMEAYDDFRLFSLIRDDFVGKRCHDKLLGAMDALEKQYLKELILVISNNDADEDDAIEVYTMKYVYDGGVSMSLVNDEGQPIASDIEYVGPDHVKPESIKLLMRIFKLCKVLKGLPRTAFASFRATFYDEVTPESYQPPGWYDADHLYTFDFPDAVDFFHIGKMNVPNSAADLCVKSAFIMDDFEVEERIEHGILDMTSNISNTSMDIPIESSPLSVKMFHETTSPISGRPKVAAINIDTAVEKDLPIPLEPVVEKKRPARSRKSLQSATTAASVPVITLSSSTSDESVALAPPPAKRGRPSRKAKNTKSNDDIVKQEMDEPAPMISTNKQTYRLDKITPPQTGSNSPHSNDQ